MAKYQESCTSVTTPSFEVGLQLNEQAKKMEQLEKDVELALENLVIHKNLKRYKDRRYNLLMVANSVRDEFKELDLNISYNHHYEPEEMILVLSDSVPTAYNDKKSSFLATSIDLAAIQLKEIAMKNSFEQPIPKKFTPLHIMFLKAIAEPSVEYLKEKFSHHLLLRQGYGHPNPCDPKGRQNLDMIIFGFKVLNHYYDTEEYRRCMMPVVKSERTVLLESCEGVIQSSVDALLNYKGESDEETDSAKIAHSKFLEMAKEISKIYQLDTSDIIPTGTNYHNLFRVLFSKPSKHLEFNKIFNMSCLIDVLDLEGIYRGFYTNQIYKNQINNMHLTFLIILGEYKLEMLNKKMESIEIERSEDIDENAFNISEYEREKKIVLEAILETKRYVLHMKELIRYSELEVFKKK